MSCYISSNDNRLYAAVEAEYGKVPAISAANRIPAVKLSVKQKTDEPVRRDKTGTRTFLGLPNRVRKQTTWSLATYMTAMPGGTEQPGHGPLFEAALGAPAKAFSGGTVASVSNGTRVQFTGAHGLSVGQAIAVGGEIRFAASVVDTTTIEVNAPFSVVPAAGSAAVATVTYMPARKLPSVSVFDCWSPSEAVQRIVNGGAVDQLTIKVNGDFHEFEFSGAARDVLDNASFEEGQGELPAFPPEPAIEAFDYTIIPGHLGQAWIGATPDRFYTLTDARIRVSNGINLRAREFGSEGPRCIVPGQRSVTVDLELLASDDDASTFLYQAARQRSPIQVMLQLGQEPGQMFGVYMKSVIPVVPELDDSETRLSWKLKSSRAQGTGDDEIVVAFA